MGGGRQDEDAGKCRSIVRPMVYFGPAGVQADWCDTCECELGDREGRMV